MNEQKCYKRLFFHRCVMRGLIPLGIIIIIMSGCRDEEFFARDPEKGITIEERLRKNPENSLFLQALENTKLINYIGKSGIWTVYAPTNEALAGVNLNPADGSQEKIDLILRLNYHIGIGFRYTSSITGPTRLVTRNGKYVALEASPFLVDGINYGILRPNQDANNGVLHQINQFLLPPPNAPEFLFKQNNLSKFSEGVESLSANVFNPFLSIDRNFDGIIDDSVFVKTYGLGVDIGSEAARRTLFVPSNEAIQAHLASIGKSSLMEFTVAERRSFLNKHILMDYRALSQITDGQELTTVGGSGKFKFDRSMIVQGDIQVSNAVIHIINKVLNH
jgi:uncharacterized surface protein with fasciclin (FAS1) repeats